MIELRSVSALVALVLLTSCTAASAPSPSPSTESTPVPTTGESPSATPGTTSPPPSLPNPTQAAEQLSVPGFAIVTADSLLIREEPGVNGEPLIDHSNCIDNPNPCGMPFTIGSERGYRWVYLLEGPVVADSYEWYLAATEMNTAAHSSTHPEAIGWVAAGDAEDRWLAPDPRPCPSQPIELQDVTNLALTKLEMLHCLAGQQLTLRGWYTPITPGEEDVPGDLEECRTRSSWLLCASLYDILRPQEAPWAGNADYLDFVIDPASGVVMPGRAQWVTVAGSFDRPESDSCGDVSAVLACRYTFAITSAEPAAAE